MIWDAIALNITSLLSAAILIFNAFVWAFEHRYIDVPNTVFYCITIQSLSSAMTDRWICKVSMCTDTRCAGMYIDVLLESMK